MAFSNPNPPHTPVLLRSSAAQPLLTDVQTLKQQLDTALERIHEYEHACAFRFFKWNLNLNSLS